MRDLVPINLESVMLKEFIIIVKSSQALRHPQSFFRCFRKLLGYRLSIRTPVDYKALALLCLWSRRRAIL